MKKYFLLILLYYFSNNLYSQWDLRINGLPEWGSCNVLGVADDSTLAIFVRPDIFPRPISISTNLGIFWNNYDTPEMWGGTDIAIIDKNDIWFCTDDGKIYYSNNGGINWVKQYADTLNSPYFDFIKFFDKDNGIVVGDAINAQLSTPILKTTNGGNNWISINTGSLIGEWSRDQFYPIEFPSLNVGYYSGSRYNKLYKTLDGGISWQIVSLPASITDIYMIKFYDENIGILLSENYPGVDSIYRTMNGGGSWTTLPPLTNSNHHDIEFLNSSPSNIWFTDYDHLYFSADTGNTWQEVIIDNNTLEARNIEFINDSIGFILCDNDKFFVTENNGGIITSADDYSISVAKDLFLFQNYPNPFNPITTLRYDLPESGFVTLKVFDILGREISTLVNEEKQAGEYQVEFSSNGFSSGIYFYVLNSREYSKTKKMVVIK